MWFAGKPACSSQITSIQFSADVPLFARASRDRRATASPAPRRQGGVQLKRSMFMILLLCGCEGVQQINKLLDTEEAKRWFTVDAYDFRGPEVAFVADAKLVPAWHVKVEAGPRNEYRSLQQEWMGISFRR